ncbi:phage tail protein [Zoogloea oryzae]|uniref:Phage tail protein n=1 Tax=Zoogloea oryzae TaxID=310767 RepID=A0ABQ6FGM2_9RHOO|nr:phage baseplate assembly protein V [Zoogloea oryzae]GLT24772.1 phage tail protein [Zoogloea oryzae]
MIPGASATPAGDRPRLYGVYPALVTDVQDPDNQGRVQVKLPFVEESDGGSALAWARLATMMAGADRGTWFIPEVDDEVLVAFTAGDPRRPVVIGALWNGVDAPPETMDSANNVRSVTSRSGHKLTFDDTAGAEKVELKTNGGHTFTLDDAAGGTVTFAHSNGATIKIDAVGNIEITANVKVKINAPAGLDVTAAMVTVNAAMSSFSGVVKADTVITNSVVSASYTPGAGNIW